MRSFLNRCPSKCSFFIDLTVTIWKPAYLGFLIWLQYLLIMVNWLILVLVLTIKSKSLSLAQTLLVILVTLFQFTFSEIGFLIGPFDLAHLLIIFFIFRSAFFFRILFYLIVFTFFLTIWIVKFISINFKLIRVIFFLINFIPLIIFFILRRSFFLSHFIFIIWLFEHTCWDGKRIWDRHFVRWSLVLQLVVGVACASGVDDRWDLSYTWSVHINIVYTGGVTVMVVVV